MKENRFDVTVGRSIFNRLERKVEKGGSSFNLFAEDKASDLLLQSPYFVDVLRERGLLKGQDHHSKYTFVFRSNLACQRFGVMRDKPELLVTTYAADKAEAIVEYLLINKPEMIQENKRRGVSHYLMYYAFRDIFLKDALQTDYISGINLKPETEIVAGIAVNRRLIKASKSYGDMLRALNINPHDITELKDVVRETNFRDLVVAHYADEPFYARRSNTITAKIGSLTDDYDVGDIDVENVTLFSSNGLQEKQKLTEKAFLHFVDAFGLDKSKLVSLLVSGM